MTTLDGAVGFAVLVILADGVPWVTYLSIINSLRTIPTWVRSASRISFLTREIGSRLGRAQAGCAAKTFV